MRSREKSVLRGTGGGIAANNVGVCVRVQVWYSYVAKEKKKRTACCRGNVNTVAREQDGVCIVWAGECMRAGMCQQWVQHHHKAGTILVCAGMWLG